ncbi:MAG: hypothetical protein CVV27_10450 [Candidatus Melainabacteria bacterium HGW-Melainabacteria-1]|nr:MAG: hypothetical protein CVV27_10450 [Candidatus Melainabacteria bacterium HGW-Melainabacteria-1]
MSDPPVSAILIAIGTELSSGQVINSNSAWIAGQLSAAGLDTLLHWTVPDDRALIRQALDRAAAETELIFLTGGLGPTSDDFTRDLVAEWAAQPLEFNPSSWERIEARAAAYGFKLVESQKQQCWFPAGAEIFPNPVGTADAFALFGETTLVVLPGPPHEIKALWQSAVAARLQPMLPALPTRSLHRWQCLGIPEGSLGELVDAAVAGEAGALTGFRAHAPYIEVKLWLDSRSDADAIRSRVEAAIGQWVVLRGDEDAALRLLASLPAETPIEIDDAVTGGLLATRLREALAQLPARQAPLSLHSSWQGPSDPKQAMTWLAEAETPETLQLAIGGFESGQWGLGLRSDGQLRFELFELPYAAEREAPSERSLRYVCEMALITAWKWLHETTQINE